MALIKSIHIMLGVSFLGLLIAGFFYINHSIAQKQPALLKSALRASFFIDLMIAVFIPALFVTAHSLVKANHFSLAVPWIKMAYLDLTLLTSGWLLLIAIKWRNYRQTDLKLPSFQSRLLFNIINVVLILLFIMIIHDAVLQRTFTWFH